MTTFTNIELGQEISISTMTEDGKLFECFTGVWLGEDCFQVTQVLFEQDFNIGDIVICEGLDGYPTPIVCDLVDCTNTSYIVTFGCLKQFEIAQLDNRLEQLNALSEPFVTHGDVHLRVFSQKHSTYNVLRTKLSQYYPHMALVNMGQGA